MLNFKKRLDMACKSFYKIGFKDGEANGLWARMCCPELENLHHPNGKRTAKHFIKYMENRKNRIEDSTD